MTTLPPFLQPVQQQHAVPLTGPWVDAIYHHDSLQSSAHALWWPPVAQEVATVLLFIPGNPGLVEFYIPFLTALYEKSERKLAILAQAHLGHSPTIPHGDAYKHPHNVSLTAQVESALQAAVALKSTYHDARVVVAGHSMGSWITLQLLRARPDVVTSTFLLFPSIAHIADTPNGRSLSWLFYPPLPLLISYAPIILRCIPRFVLSSLYRDWPDAQVDVLQSFIRSPAAVYASLTLAHDEMNAIRELDVELLQQHCHRIHIFFAEKDDWVGDQRETIIKALDTDEDSVQVIHGEHDIPHAFCINHSEQLALQCLYWLQTGKFL